MLNFGLMKNPMNWVIITLMVALGSLAVHYVMISVGTAPDAS